MQSKVSSLERRSVRAWQGGTRRARPYVECRIAEEKGTEGRREDLRKGDDRREGSAEGSRGRRERRIGKEGGRGLAKESEGEQCMLASQPTPVSVVKRRTCPTSGILPPTWISINLIDI